MNMKHLVLMIVVIAGLSLLLGCEGVSVSVNAEGDIAFARSEGIFFYNPDQNSLSLVEWKYGSEVVPVIVRWSPDGKTIAYTEKSSADSQETRVYVIGRNGEGKRQLYSTEHPITQMEWDPKGIYISVAQAGEDTDLGVADLVIISVEQEKVVKVMENTGDSHAWFDNNNLVFMKIDEVNPDNSGIFKGSLRMYRLSLDEDLEIAQTMVPREGSIVVNPFRRQIGFTAIGAGSDVGVYEEYMSDEAYAYIVQPGNVPELASPDVVNFIAFSPDGVQLLAKTVTWDGADLSVIDWKTKQTRTLVSPITDTVSIDSAEIQIYPAWYDSDRVLYFLFSRVYGSNGSTLRLMILDKRKGSPANLQIEIDKRIHQLVLENGGY